MSKKNASENVNRAFFELYAATQPGQKGTTNKWLRNVASIATNAAGYLHEAAVELLGSRQPADATGWPHRCEVLVVIAAAQFVLFRSRLAGNRSLESRQELYDEACRYAKRASDVLYDA